MPPWLATGMIVATVAVVCALYNFWSNPHPHEAGGHCDTPGCRQSGTSNQNNERRNNRTGSHRRHNDLPERYDTLPDSRQRCINDDKCPICLEHMYRAPQHTLQCHHRLHTECFMMLRSQSDFCPICRRRL